MSKRLKKEIDDLEASLKIAVKIGDFSRQSEIELELAELWHEEDQEKSIEYYECALKSSKKAKNDYNTILAYRNLGELYLSMAETEEEYDRAFKYLNLQLKQAEFLQDQNLVQLALHTLAHAYFVEATNFSIESINLTKALIYARRCLDYLNFHEHTIDGDRDAILSGKDSSRRRAGISSVLSDIYMRFGAIKKSFEHTNTAVDYALKHTETREPLFLYQCNFVKLELLHGKPYLELVETMRTYSNKHKIKENRGILERKYYTQLLTCNQNNISKFCDVTDYFLKQYDIKDNAEFIEPVLKFLYSLMMLKKDLTETVTNNDRSKLYEDVADKACTAEFYELGLVFYKEMLKYAELDKNNERIYLACGSIAETSRRNLHDYKTAIEYQQRAFKLARDLYPNDKDRICFEEYDLFFTEIKHGYSIGANKDIQYQKFLSLIQKADTYRKKVTVLDEFTLFLAFYDDEKELKRWSDELIKYCKLKESEPALTVYEDKDVPDLKPKERYDLRDYVARYKNKKEREDVNWKNNKGETRLHEAAKIDNANEVEQLIKSGQNVNALDYAGWTPLMEAVSYGHLNNVRILCQHRADVNTASSEGLVDEYGKVGPSGITPLMDACASGNVRIARLLLRFKADINLLNENGETAFDILQNYTKHNAHHLTEKDLLMCQSLLDELDKKTRKRTSQILAPQESDTLQNKRFYMGYNFNSI